MKNQGLTDLEITPPSVVRSCANDFAIALAKSPQYRAFDQAEEALRQDQDAQRIITAYQSKQQALRALMMLGAASQEDRAELARLQQEFQTHPTIAAFLAAQNDLVAVCQVTADILSRHLGVSFAGACKKGCC